MLSNDDVVRLCLRKMSNGTAPEQICEELMTECLSPDLLMTGTDNMTVVLICFLHNKPYDELCKRAKELNKRYSDEDATVEKNEDNDSFPKCEQNGRLSAAAELNGSGIDSGGGGGGDIANVNATDDDKDISKLNGDVANDVSDDIDRLASPETIPSSSDGASANASETVVPSEDEKTDKKEESANDDPKIIQESKKFKETDSEDELK